MGVKYQCMFYIKLFLTHYCLESILGIVHTVLLPHSCANRLGSPQDSDLIPQLELERQAVGSTALEIDELSVGYQGRSVEVREAQRYDEFWVTNASAYRLRDLNLVPDTLLLYAMFRADSRTLHALLRSASSSRCCQSWPPRILTTSAQTS